MQSTIKRLGTVLAIGLLTGGASLWAQPAGGAAAEDNTSVWKWANFAILVIGLGYAIGKYMPGLYHARTTEIQKGIAEAQQVKRSAEKRAAEVDEKMRRLGAEIDAFRGEAKAEMEREGARLRQETAEQIEKIHRQSTLEIEAAGKTARRELREYAAELALDLASQRIRQRMTPAADAALISDFMSDLERQETRPRESAAWEGSRN
jgi:F-type H+-transporting ATPase subunit b